LSGDIAHNRFSLKRAHYAGREMNLTSIVSDIGDDIKKRLVPDWKRALSFYSVKAGIVGGSVLAGIAAVQAAGITVPEYWTQVAAFLTITGMVAGRLIQQGGRHDQQP
jgi:hypothetical protein